MIRALAVCIFLSATALAPAQVTLSTVAGGIATPVGVSYDFGEVAVGATAVVQFRLVNTGASDVYLTQLSGLDRSLSSTPPYPPYYSVDCGLSPDLCGNSTTQVLPKPIRKQNSLDFTVQFTPYALGSPNATMTIAAGNTFIVTLKGTGVAGASGSLTVLLNNQPVAAGQTIGFGDVAVVTSRTLALVLANQTNTALAIPPIALASAAAFRLSGPALTAKTLAPAASAELDIAFSPTAAGQQQATLTIGASTWPITGNGLAIKPPDLPTPAVQITLASAASAQQGSISVSLDAAASQDASGTLTLVFKPAVSGVTDDPSVTFADGTRAVSFTFSKGAAAAKFAGSSSIGFGTGTTAGTLSFSAALGTHTTQASVTIPAAPIGIDAQVPARNVACAPAELYCTAVNIELQINGWDNTRSVSNLSFTFYDPAGNMIAPGAIDVPAASAFSGYFAASGLGGVFGLHALFPVTGDVDHIVGATVALTNSAGTTQTARITF